MFYDVHKENMFRTNLEDGREAPSKASNLYIYTLLVWVSGRLFASNKRQNFFGFPLKYIQGENV